MFDTGSTEPVVAQNLGRDLCPLAAMIMIMIGKCCNKIDKTITIFEVHETRFVVGILKPFDESSNA